MSGAEPTIVTLGTEDFQEVNRLVSAAFGYQAPHRFFDDFPVWNSDQSIHLGIYSTTEGKRQLVSHVGIRYANIFDNGKLRPVALIGAVATDMEFRRKGLSNTLMKEAIRLAEDKKAEWIFLWGSEHEFYERLGFLLAGNQYRALLASVPGVMAHRFPQVKSGVSEKIFSYICHQKKGIQVTESDRDWYFSHKTVKWFWLENPFAFIAFERGMDLPHIVHEWGGDEEQLKVLFSHVMSYDPQAQLLGSRNGLLTFGIEEIDLIEEFLCLARPSKMHGQSAASWSEHFWISGLNAC